MTTITVEIPDTLVSILAAEGKDLTRTVIEAMALEGYRTERLTESDLRDLLGFVEVHGFLKDHDVFIHYTADDLDRDPAAAIGAAHRYQRHKGGLRPEPDQRDAILLAEEMNFTAVVSSARERSSRDGDTWSSKSCFPARSA